MIDPHDCAKEESIQVIREDVREIRKDVKVLLQTMAAVQVKSTIWGSIGGTIPFILAIIIWLFGVKK